MAVWIIAVGMSAVLTIALTLGLNELRRRIEADCAGEDGGLWVS